ncbi:unnamed protein product [Acanthoscelides obtectus]|uniref:Uncharacterized protein n=1 Tax=Acanthoscelides obtectus TaxID=200917 RepID=A0A9P0L8U2_ACAOB|nr:unnamed protein product [Acanthoscelides obtectus]CAK1661251.1 hypothetical protein AOBTE_LOCUS22539 [Acanthoscelides obtectus]
MQMCINLRGEYFEKHYRVVLFPYAKLKRHPSYHKYLSSNLIQKNNCKRSSINTLYCQIGLTYLNRQIGLTCVAGGT